MDWREIAREVINNDCNIYVTEDNKYILEYDYYWDKDKYKKQLELTKEQYVHLIVENNTLSKG